jgi:hypothetical protein
LHPGGRTARSSPTRTGLEFWVLREKEKTLVAKPKKPRDKVFLNILYDKKFERLFLAYIAGLVPMAWSPTQRWKSQIVLDGSNGF